MKTGSGGGRWLFGSTRGGSPPSVSQRHWRRCQASVGIDLGTCNSAVAVMKEGRPHLVELLEGQYTMPSLAFCTPEGLLSPVEMVERDVELQNILSDAKRFIGRDYYSVREEAQRCGSTVVRAEDGSAQFCCPAVQRPISAQEVSSVVIKSLLRRAELYLHESVDHAVISVPAYFNQRQKAATIEACGLTGIHNVMLLQEPVAAALAYGFGRPHEQESILVVDVGGGTFDVSILTSFEGIMEVVAYAGDPILGGKDFDYAVSEWILDQLKHPARNGKMLPSTMKAIAEKLKIEVIRRGSACCKVGGETLCLDLATFQKRTQQLSERFLPPLLTAGKSALIDWMDADVEASACVVPSDPFRPPPKKITQVVLAGGSSSLPALHALISKMTGIRELKSPVDPKLCVAYGAALFSGMLQGDVDGIEIMDGAYSHQLHDRDGTSTGGQR